MAEHGLESPVIFLIGKVAGLAGRRNSFRLIAQARDLRAKEGCHA